MINAKDVLEKPFEKSHLLTKLRRLIVVPRIFGSIEETKSVCHKAVTFDLDNPEIYWQVSEDYELVRRTIKERGFEELTGKMGVLVQPRTKGQANTTTRGFYAR